MIVRSRSARSPPRKGLRPAVPITSEDAAPMRSRRRSQIVYRSSRSDQTRTLLHDGGAIRYDDGVEQGGHCGGLRVAIRPDDKCRLRLEHLLQLIELFELSMQGIE